jgi:hypothetical protein
MKHKITAASMGPIAFGAPRCDVFTPGVRTGEELRGIP